MISNNKQVCDVCGTCVGVCPVDAIIIEFSEVIIQVDSCIQCSACVQICPVDALSEDS